MERSSPWSRSRPADTKPRYSGPQIKRFASISKKLGGRYTFSKPGTRLNFCSVSSKRMGKVVGLGKNAGVRDRVCGLFYAQHRARARWNRLSSATDNANFPAQQSG